MLSILHLILNPFFCWIKPVAITYIIQQAIALVCTPPQDLIRKFFKIFITFLMYYRSWLWQNKLCQTNVTQFCIKYNSASLSISFHFSDILTVQYLLILNLTVCDISCVLSLIRKICKGPSINNVGKHFRYIFDTPLPHVGTSFL